MHVRDVRRRPAHDGVQAEQRGGVAGAGRLLRGVVLLGQADQVPDYGDLGGTDLLGGVVEAVGGVRAALGRGAQVAVRRDERVPVLFRRVACAAVHRVQGLARGPVGVRRQAADLLTRGAPCGRGRAQLVLVRLRPVHPGLGREVGELGG
ncbi:hypothetical protein F0L68_38190 [Solihabitans fulvus]|uniref:Uncharacterized protein n=1 Tax=Solihabitans fulvus TaxID=1892852 RepID=A0A5B2WL87_9PSEU|nr:hypothetical protein F0L68_38190 [Solihabitans fulvus]